jgi:hypothetical protein
MPSCTVRSFCWRLNKTVDHLFRSRI